MYGYRVRYYTQRKFNPFHGIAGRFASAPGLSESGISSEQVAKALHKKYPKTTFHFDDIEQGFAQRIGQHLDELLETYPYVQEKLSYVGTPSKAVPHYAEDTVGLLERTPNAYGAVTEDVGWDALYSQTMILSPKNFSDEASFAKKTARDAQSGWHVEGSDDPLSVVTHEFGHLVHNALLYGGSGKAMPGVTAIGEGDKVGEVSKMTEFWTNIHSSQGKQVSKYVRSQTDPTKVLEEGFAEGFAKIHSSKARDPYTLAQEEFLQSMKGTWKKNPKEINIQSPDEKDKEQAQKLLALVRSYQKSSLKGVLPPLKVTLYRPEPHVWVEDPYGSDPSQE